MSALGRDIQPPAISWLMNLALDRPGLISLAAGFTDGASLPVAETRRAVHRVLKDDARARRALQYGAALGDERLRSLTARRAARADGGESAPPYAVDRLLITHGSQQLLYLLVEALCDPGDIVLVEDPTYFVFLSILKSKGVKCRGVALDADGIQLESLDAVLDSLRRTGDLRRVKLLYLVSYFQNPTGLTASHARKREALALLRTYERFAGHPLYLCEDAAYRDLRFEGPDVPSLLGVDGAPERVVYAGTYSKPFATGLRVGYSWLPEPLFSAVGRIKGNHDFGASNFPQQIIAEALESGLYDRHLPVMRKRYAAKAKALCQGLEEHLPEASFRRPRGGLCAWAELPGRHSAGVRSKFFQEALRRDVLYVPGELCFAEDSARRAPRRGMRLSFGSASPAQIQEGLSRLGEVLRALA